jgi:hypothetical protein
MLQTTRELLFLFSSFSEKKKGKMMGSGGRQEKVPRCNRLETYVGVHSQMSVASI